MGKGLSLSTELKNYDGGLQIFLLHYICLVCNYLKRTELTLTKGSTVMINRNHFDPHITVALLDPRKTTFDFIALQSYNFYFINKTNILKKKTKQYYWRLRQTKVDKE
jgi:hypothetical protein